MIELTNYSIIVVDDIVKYSRQRRNDDIVMILKNYIFRDGVDTWRKQTNIIKHVLESLSKESRIIVQTKHN